MSYKVWLNKQVFQNNNLGIYILSGILREFDLVIQQVSQTLSWNHSWRPRQHLEL